MIIRNVFDVVLVCLLASVLALPVYSQEILVPMDGSQSNHLKAYGAVYWALTREVQVDWLLNYRGGSFLLQQTELIESELRIRNISYELVSGAQSSIIIAEIENEDNNTSIVRLEKAPEIAVYAPTQTLPWDDAVLLALTYAEVPYEMIYDADVLEGRLHEFDWLHLHHEDFTGQYGKFFNYRSSC